MGSAPQSNAVRDVTLTSKLVEMTLRTSTPKFRSIGTSAMPAYQMQVTNHQQTTINQELPLQPCSLHPSSIAVLFGPL